MPNVVFVDQLVDRQTGEEINVRTLSQKEDFVDFYINKAGTIVEETDNSVATMVLSERVTMALSAITTPNGDTLDNYQNLIFDVEYYYPADGADWHSTPTFLYSAGGYGVLATKFDGSSLCIQAGRIGYFYTGDDFGGSKILSTGFNDATMPIRINIKGVRA